MPNKVARKILRNITIELIFLSSPDELLPKDLIILSEIFHALQVSFEDLDILQGHVWEIKQEVFLLIYEIIYNKMTDSSGNHSIFECFLDSLTFNFLIVHRYIALTKYEGTYT